MAWVLVAVTVGLAALVLALTVLVLRLRTRLAAFEGRLQEPRPAPAPVVREEPDFVITHVGEPEPEPVPTVAAPVFADIVARESVVHAASLVHGLRRALSAESRNRIRFHMRQEVKRSRKQRKTELRAVRREWAARQRGESAA